MNKKFTVAAALLLLLAVVFSAVSCSGNAKKPESASDPSGNETEASGGEPVSAGVITLSADGVDVGKTGAVYENGVVTITKAGSYTVTGTNENLSIVVTVEKTEQVELVLDNAKITNPSGPAIFCTAADKLFVTAKENTENFLKDGKSYKTSDADGPNAALYCADDMTLRGAGTLTVTGLYKNGVSSKNDIKIKDLTLIVDAYNTAIRGKDSVTVVSGSLTVTAGKDGIKASEDQKEGKGFVSIEDGSITITAQDDAIQATFVITISGGKVIAEAGGKLTNAPAVDIAEGTLNA